MIGIDKIIATDLQHIWHPCSQMKDYESFKPLVVESARGCYLHLANGQKVIDAISSWWCKSLGHGHPRLQKALHEQIEKFEHVILANTTNETIVDLSQRLAKLTTHLNKVSFAGDGSCAIEMAIKMSLHARQILGEQKRNKFIALSNSYHGETCIALAVSDLGLYRQPYESLLPEVNFLQGIPYVSGQDDPLWADCSAYWPNIEMQLNQQAEQTTAIIIEPIVQGAGGMKIYSADFLRRLRAWTQQHQIHLIADEIMTGMGRTGTMLACQHAKIEPDFLCLSKGLTAGWLPLSVMLTSDAIYALFYDDYDKGKSFLHSHTYSGNVLAAAVALETFNILEQEAVLQKTPKLESTLLTLMQELAQCTGYLHNVRGIGAMVAADLCVEKPPQRLGYAIFQEAVKRGALLRPLGNTLYWFPPLNVELDVLKKLQIITEQSLTAVLNSAVISA